MHEHINYVFFSATTYATNELAENAYQ